MNGWDVVGSVFVALGVFFIIMSAVGLLRLPDVYSRLSAVTKAATLGVVLILAGAFFLKPSWTAFITLALAAALQFLTAPVGGFALGRAAYRSKSPLAAQTNYDELATGEASAPVADDG
ncbi:monovalent cation/H(+) antiporter subunit G [Phytoactinopolyspora alkaliphila]|uniref:Monovalent cation/H(+) antiporter subunit G n=1 Tax=Phytoactinopolyspora alkaliphila TaxID=1783498 RepID=A0A6N9YLD1_9ACTN|nr:monovalent cation/H(+) antiporter subunit G [Phytoactinopolyspora alkaliphila]NED95803.1 monovalent cation/H(+) antiporter subunit G [Phytoactinopolyspora alkaliphila]